MTAKLVKDSNGYWLDSNDEVIKDFLQEGKLSKENCDEIFGVVDVDKLAEEETRKYLPGCPENIMNFIAHKRFFKIAFEQAMELYQPKVINVDVKMKIVKEESTKNSPAKTFKLDENDCLILKKI
jgi:hypothetical protein